MRESLKKVLTLIGHFLSREESAESTMKADEDMNLRKVVLDDDDG